MKKVKNGKKKYLYFGLAFVVLIIGVSYAYILEVRQGLSQPYITTGLLDVAFSEEVNVITLSSALPQTDTAGASTTPYSFTINNNTEVAVNYNLKLTVVCCNQSGDTCLDNTLNPDIIRYKLTDVDNTTSQMESNPTNSMFLSNKDLTAKNGANDDDSYQLQLWIDSTAINDDLFTKTGDVFNTDANGNYIGKVFCAKLEVTSEQAY